MCIKTIHPYVVSTFKTRQSTYLHCGIKSGETTKFGVRGSTSQTTVGISMAINI